MTITNTRLKAHKNSLLEQTFLAESAVLDGQIVKPGATEGTVVPCGANEEPLGVACNGVTAAKIAAYEAETEGIESVEVIVMLVGIAPVLAGHAVAFNDWVISDANGRITPVTGDGTDHIIGICMDAATGDEQESHILVNRSPAVD